MLNRKRTLRLDICDYNNSVKCNLFDSESNVDGQATDVFVKTERNGWKELSFSLPCSNYTDEGTEENYRIQYLIADYRIRFLTDDETDWYLISEPKIEHDAKTKKVNVTAGHIAQLLKTKNLGLEFSDDEGNNVGTAEELLTTILEGTGWNVGYVEDFLEDDGETIKVRSLTASTKTGAFKLVSDLCEKFEAKPIYHGDTRTIDLYLMNPFARVKEGEIPAEVIKGADVLELYYNNNVHNITRTLNAENIVTRLYAYGAYGDHVTGMCSLQTVEHAEYKFAIDQNYTDQEFMFEIKDKKRFFTASVESGAELVWSTLDFLSRSYVWDGQTAYVCYDEPATNTYIELNFSEVTSVKNCFDYVMDFGYYYEVGLLTDEMFQKLAKFQRDMPAFIQESTEAATAFQNSELELSKVAESNTGFLKLNVGSYDAFNSGLRLHINKTENYPDGVIYRSDYDESRKHYFSWFCAEKLKENGDPVTGIGSVVYIVHDTDPVTWDRAYIRYIDDEQKTMDYSYRNVKDPDTITLWMTYNKYHPSDNDRFYLFSTNSITGRMGVIESENEAMLTTIQQATKVVTETHPTYFIWDDDPMPSIDGIINGYGWTYKSFSHTMDFGQLYFCYGAAKERTWNRVYYGEEEPMLVVGAYFFNQRSRCLFHGEQSGWVNIKDSGIHITDVLYYAPDAEAQRLAQSFSKVIFYCYRHDRLHKGLYNEYIYEFTSDFEARNYAIRSDFGFLWAFSADRTIPAGSVLTLDSKLNNISVTDSPEDIFKAEEKPYDSVTFADDNLLTKISVVEGSIDRQTGIDVVSKNVYRTSNISVYPDETYQYRLPSDAYGIFYDGNKRYLEYVNMGGNGTFTTGHRAKFLRIVSSVKTLSSYDLYVKDRESKMFIGDLEYRILSPVTTSGDREGLMYLVKRFADLADETYSVYLKQFLDAQKAITDEDNDIKVTLGDIYREGYWQNGDYVEGDEEKLYKDALDNIEKISRPEATYDLTFLDLFGANVDQGYATSETQIDWPDIDITNAVHLIDEDLHINLWAYLDVVNKCYDQPWKTSITINTDLSTIGQHSFTDVLTHIAEVASVTKTHQELYQRAENISSAGKIAAENLEGMISANVTQITGGSSSWYTDDKGNMIFESADGNSAMMLSGAGYCIASGKDEDGNWEWRSAATGSGMNADEITTGYLSANRIMAGTITADHINSTFGEQLDISSNVALTLYATIDGEKPAGSVLTPTVNSTDSYIQIGAKNGANPAYINVMTGGIMNIKAGSKMNIESNGEIHIKAGSKFTVDSPQFTIDENGNATFLGELTGASGTFNGTVSAGKIEGGTINIGNGTFTVSNTGAMSATSAYIEGDIHASDISGGTIDGAEITGGTLDIGSGTFKVTNTGALTASSATITGGTITIGSNFSVDQYGKLTAISAEFTGNIKSGSTITGSEFSGGKITIGNNFSVDTSGNMKATNAEFTGSIKSGSTITGASISSGSITIGNNFSVDTSGNMKATNAEFTGSIKSGSTITCGTGFSVDALGNMVANNATITGNSSFAGELNGATGTFKGTVSAGSFEGGEINIGSGTFKVTSTGAATASNITVTGGSITIKDGTTEKFKVTDKGVLTATEVDVSGKITATDGKIANWFIKSSFIANATTIKASTVGIGDGTYTLWAGKGNAETDISKSLVYIKNDGSVKFGKFTVNTSGNATCTNLSMTGGSISGDDITISAKSVQIKSGSSYISLADVSSTANTAKSTADTAKANAATAQSTANTAKANAATAQSTADTAKANAAAAQNSANAAQNTADSYANGTAKVKWVESTGITIKDNAIDVSATGVITMAANSSLTFKTTSSNTAFVLNNDGVSIGTAKSIALAAGGTFTINSENFSIIDGKVTVKGTVEASDGKIGGWDIGTDKLSHTSGKVGLAVVNSDDGITFWAGNTTDASSAAFRVTRNGTLYASHATIAGDSTFSGTLSANCITSGHLSANYLQGGTIDASEISVINLNADNISSGHISADKISGGTISASLISGGTFNASTMTVTNLSADSITSGYMSADKIQGGTLTLGGANNIYGSLTIKNESGSDVGYWNKNGITAITGQIGGWNIGSNYIGNVSGTYGNSTIALRSDATGTDLAIWAGASQASSDIPFYVMANGKMKATNAEISGTVTATTGQIGGWYIGSDWIGNNSVTYGNCTIGLRSSATGGNIAIWAGHDFTATPPFTVLADGTVIITQLRVLDPDTGETKTVDLYRNFTPASSVKITSATDTWNETWTPSGKYVTCHVHITLSNGKTEDRSFSHGVDLSQS